MFCYSSGISYLCNMKNSSEKTIVPPIKIQGIKTKLVPWIRELLETNNISTDRRWIEPFTGSGVVGFNVGRLFKSHIMTDSNPHIIQFYKGVLDNSITAEYVRANLEYNGELLQKDGEVHYKEVRRRFNEEHSPIDFLFLSRAGFNGMMRFNSKGEFNIPFCKKPERFSKAYITKICNQVQAVADVMHSADSEWTFKNQDFRVTIKEATENDIIYCDPPYYGRYTEYYSNWSKEDERELFLMLSECPAKFVLSTWHHNEMRENPMIEMFWKRFNIVTHDHFYHVGASEENRRKVTEALIYNF